MSKVKPIIPYFGGKSYKLKTLLPLFPEHYEAYFEPFFGGGSVGLNVPTDKARHFNDINPHLMNMYLQLKNNTEEVIRLTDIMFRDRSKQNYEALRTNTFEDKVLEAARYLFLVKSSYGGETSHNMHFGHFNNNATAERKRWCKTKRDSIRETSQVLKGARLTCGTYELLDVKQGDFVFADPPYVKAAMDYIKPWREADHFKLFDWWEEQTSKGVLAMLTYDNHPLIHKLYQHWNITVSKYRRSVATRDIKLTTTTSELIIRNYE